MLHIFASVWENKKKNILYELVYRRTILFKMLITMMDKMSRRALSSADGAEMCFVIPLLKSNQHV